MEHSMLLAMVHVSKSYNSTWIPESKRCYIMCSICISSGVIDVVKTALLNIFRQIIFSVIFFIFPVFCPP